MPELFGADRQHYGQEAADFLPAKAPGPMLNSLAVGAEETLTFTLRGDQAREASTTHSPILRRRRVDT